MQRFLDHQPIRARRPTLRQQITKWAHRHTALVWSVAAILLVSTIALAVSTVLVTQEQSATEAALSQAEDNHDEAERQRQRAEENFRRAREAVDTYLTKVSEDVLLNQPSMQLLRRDLLELALKYYQELADQRADDPTLRAELAEAYLRLGNIKQEIGSQSEALEMFEQALDIRKRLVEQTPDHLARQLAMSVAQQSVAKQHGRMGNYDDQSTVLSQVIDVLDRLEDTYPASEDLLVARVRQRLSPTTERGT